MLRDRAQLTVRSVRYPGVPVCGLRAARGAGIRRMHRSLGSLGSSAALSGTDRSRVWHSRSQHAQKYIEKKSWK